MIAGLLGMFCLTTHAVEFNVVQSTESYEDVVENVTDAIIGRSLNISNVLHIGEMLNRTGENFGYEKNVFRQAEIIQFCSANLAHQMVSVNPNNMVLCPFAISIYQLNNDDTTVYLAYRTPTASQDDAEIISKVQRLYKNIIQEVTE